MVSACVNNAESMVASAEIEIKFFDRLKALEKLASMGGGENSESSFIKALSEGARLLSEEEDN